jgi:hypothetical protein
VTKPVASAVFFTVGDTAMNKYEDMDRDALLQTLRMFAANWLAHDGCWFLAAEERFGIDAAIHLDEQSWARFAAVEARRITTTFNLPAEGGLPALEQALGLRMYALINDQRTEWSSDRSCLRFVLDRCKVQETRRKKGLPDFPCKSVGIVEFSTFARTIDPRIKTRCVHCPPDALENQYCAWEFSVEPANSTDGA